MIDVIVNLTKIVFYIVGSIVILYAFAWLLWRGLPPVKRRYGGGTWW
jgi:hypothetical protein